MYRVIKIRQLRNAIIQVVQTAIAEYQVIVIETGSRESYTKATYPRPGPAIRYVDNFGAM